MLVATSWTSRDSIYTWDRSNGYTSGSGINWLFSNFHGPFLHLAGTLVTVGGGSFGDAFNALGGGIPKEDGDLIKTLRSCGTSGTGSLLDWVCLRDAMVVL